MAESKKMMKREIAFMKAKGAPKDMVKHEKAEAGMKKGGMAKGKFKPFTKGGGNPFAKGKPNPFAKGKPNPFAKGKDDEKGKPNPFAKGKGKPFAKGGKAC